jgi:tetratricopeptide (TPR) repeat protein
VLVSLSRAMSTSNGSLERRAGMARQAVEMARRVNDPLALYETLHNSVLANRQPDKIEERIAVLNEMCQLAEQIGDAEKVLDTTLLRIYDQLELGDIQSVKADLEAYTRVAEEIRQPFFIHNIGVMQTGLLLLAGRFEEAERLAQEALDTAQRIGVENADGVFGMQMFTMRREQGRLQELAPVIKYFVTHHSAATTWRPGLALIYSDLGLGQEARTEFEYLAANDFADLPQDALWLTCIIYLSEVCAFLGDADRAAVLYQHLRPYAGHNVVVGFVVACYGAVSRYLGLLATTMSRWEAAEGHFEEALKLNARMGAKPWLAHTQYQYAAMLLTRDQAGDRDQAMSLLDEALVTARELGMKSLIEKAEALNQATMIQ